MAVCGAGLLPTALKGLVEAWLFPLQNISLLFVYHVTHAVYIEFIKNIQLLYLVFTIPNMCTNDLNLPRVEHFSRL